MTMPIAIDPTNEVDSPESRLLLLTAKVDLNEDQLNESRALASQVTDWPFFTVTAANKYSVPLAYRALQQCAVDIVPEETMSDLKKLTKVSGLSTLKVLAAQTKFHTTCIAPIRAQHAYLKGVSLSRKFHHSVTDRFCRDVDVLVADDDFDRVGRTSVEAGYRMVIGYDPTRFVQTNDEIEFMLKYEDVIELISPEGVSIDLHRRLTKMSFSFDADQIFDEAEIFEISGTKFRTLSDTVHFVYICYHHSRHFWSRLHWLADVNAIISSSSFDEAAALDLADRIGIRPTVEAVIELNDLVSRPGLWSHDSASMAREGGYALLRACLFNLGGGTEREMQLREHKKLGDFVATWQISKNWRGKMLMDWYRRNLRPRSAQYLKRPRPSSQHWIYTLQNSWMLIRDTFNWVRSRGLETVFTKRKS